MVSSRAFFCLGLWVISGIHHTVNHRPTTRLSQSNVNTKITQLMAGQHSRLTESFIFVVKDSEDYSQLRQIINDLLPSPPDSFEAKAYVAVFLGQRRTNGFNIELSADQNGVLILTQTKPPPGAMLKMVLSAPFKLFAISVQPNEPLSFMVDETWKRQSLEYRLTNVEGPLRRVGSGSLDGSVELLRSGSYLTCFFNLATADGKYKIKDVSTAEVDANFRFKVSATAVIENKGKQLRLSGKLEITDLQSMLIFQTAEGSTLSLTDRP